MLWALLPTRSNISFSTCSILIIHTLPKNYSLKTLGFLGSQCCLGLQKYPYAGLAKEEEFSEGFSGGGTTIDRNQYSSQIFSFAIQRC